MKHAVIYTWQIPLSKATSMHQRAAANGRALGINVEINLGLSTYQRPDKLMKFNSYVLFRRRKRPFVMIAGAVPGRAIARR